MLLNGPLQSRRGLLAAGFVGLSARALIRERTEELTSIDLDGLIDRVRPLARHAVRTPGGDDTPYLLHTAALLARLEVPAADPASSEQPIRFETLVFHRPLLIYAIRMAPGARFDLHDHLDYSGVLRVVSGSVEAKHYEFVDHECRDDPEVELRETSHLRLGAGSVAILGRRRDNLHDVTAGPDGAYLIDLFTHDHNRSRSREFRIKPEPDRPDGLIHRAIRID